MNLIKGKKLVTQASSNSWTPNSIDAQELSIFLARQNSLLESLIQIYKQFLKMEASTSREGQCELSKKLCIIESIKFYVEHLMLFHKFNMLMPPPPPPPTSTSSTKVTNGQDLVVQANYLSEMQVNLKIIENRWMKRRQEQIEQIDAISSSTDDNRTATTASADTDTNHDINYPFTYLVDCLFEECRGYANIAPLFVNSTTTTTGQRSDLGGYPPKSIIVSCYFITLIIKRTNKSY